MELLLQALDELDDLVIGLRLAAMPWVASLLHAGRLALEALRPAADAFGTAANAVGTAVALMDASAALLCPAAPGPDAAQSSVLDLPLPSVRGARSVRNVTE